MTKFLKNKLLLALTALLTVILAIFGVSLATPLQSVKADAIDTSHWVCSEQPFSDTDKRGKYFRLKYDSNSPLPAMFEIRNYTFESGASLCLYIDDVSFTWGDPTDDSTQQTIPSNYISIIAHKSNEYIDFYVAENAVLVWDTFDYNSFLGFGVANYAFEIYEWCLRTDTFSCEHTENLVAITSVENIQGKTLRLSPPVSDSPTTLSIYTSSSDTLLIDIYNSAADGQAITMGCLSGQLNTEDYFTWTYCAEGNHFDLKFLQTATYIKENSGENIFVNAAIDCSVPVYVVVEETEEPGTDTEQPEQKPTDTTNWYKHVYTSGTSVQGQYVRFECASGHGEMFTFHLYGLSSTSIPLAYTNGAIKTTAGYKMTGEAVVLRTTDTVVDIFFSSDFAVDKISAFDAEKMLGEKKSVSIFLLSQDGTIENNPSTPVVPDDPNTDKPDDGDGSVDQQPSDSKNEDLKDTNANLDFIKISVAVVSISVLGFVVYYIIRRIRR